jgi:hypothetical protein
VKVLLLDSIARPSGEIKNSKIAFNALANYLVTVLEATNRNVIENSISDVG